MDEAKQQLVDKLKSSNNVLVTVSRSPSVDQLAACLGLALTLNKQGKHVAAVFSGNVPSTLEFLQPEETLEKNTDSLRDFIIALDKSKADKLRYKVEDNVVRIFITPYKTSISEADLEFSQGDFNVDLVVALGVGQQEDIDEAITAHGRILHDATVASVNTVAAGELGSINWQDAQASSLSEMVTDLTQLIDPNLLDSQIATALLTGIVAETERFSNDKTSPNTMSVSANLMAAGANQQLVASKLEEPEQPPEENGSDEEGNSDDGLIQVDHSDESTDEEQPPELPGADDSDSDLPDEPADTELPDLPEPSTPEESVDEEEPPAPQTYSTLSPGSDLVTEPPVLGGDLSANTKPESLDPVTDPMSLPNAEPPQLLERKPGTAPTLTPPPTDWTPPSAPSSLVDDQAQPDSLSQLEDRVKQDEEAQPVSVEEVRDEVNRAITSDPNARLEPIQALNAQPLGTDLHPGPVVVSPDPVTPPVPEPPAMATPPAAATEQPQVTDSNAPPPVPPPIPFQFGNPSQQQ